MPKQVIKRDGTLEPYIEEKITRVVITAGLPPDQAHPLTTQVTRWINTHTETSISSLAIRDKVLELLTDADSSVADFFRWYQRSKDIKP